LLLCLCIAAAAGAWAEDEPMQLFLELVLNELQTGQIIEVQAVGEHYLVARRDLIAAGLKLDAEGADPVALDSLAGVRSTYEQELQQLKLDVPVEWLPRQQIGVANAGDRIEAVSSLGALLNYDFFYSDTEGGDAVASAYTEQRVFGDKGLLSNSGVYRQSFGGEGDLDGYYRYDSYWRFNDQQRLLSYGAGDVISGALTWNSAVRMGGVQMSRNFTLRPDLISYPMPRFSGDASVPSTVDLFIDNTRVSSETLKPGPFTFNSAPVISGAGQATVVTTDALGRQVATTVPFYVTNTLLQKGLTDYSLSLGRLRQNYGLENFSYGRYAGSGTFRYGVNDQLTLESHAETASGFQLVGLGSTFAVGNFGSVTSSLSQSRYNQSGQQYSLGYSYFSRLFGVSAQRIERTRGYSDLSVVEALDTRPLDNFLLKRSDQVTFTVSPPGVGSLGLGYFASVGQDGSSTRLINLSWSRTLWKNISFYVSLNRVIGEEGYAAQAQVVVPFDMLSTLSASTERSRSGRYSQRVNYSRNAPSEGGLGMNLNYGSGDSEYTEADFTWRNQKVQLQGGAYSDAGNLTHWGDASGSLVAMDGGLFATNRVDDAFVLVSTEGYPGVPVSFEHQLIGETDAKGHLLVPWVPSYYRGQYEVDLLKLPSNVVAGDTQRFIAVGEGSGALLAFELRQQFSASIVLVDENGAFLPQGAVATLVGGGARNPVGWDGVAYFENLAAHNELDVRIPNAGQCRASFDIDPQIAEMAQIGPLTCHRTTGAP